MKKIIAGVVLASASTMAFANGPAGCGLGTAVVFPDANEWYEHVLAATTNATSGNQTFGMTSGTLGCEGANGPLKLAQAFMEDNMDQLAADVARGEGETLAALAEVIGVEAQDTAAFNRTLQSNFDNLFSTEATSGSAYEAMKAAMASDVALQKYLG
ncbi:DUF3015 domain-containing protein [Venatoribacter cucullus]|uniref:DUF3015 domain-containing protein n=1 Tax=Venatoribacter cucullus TaxID=2661630 RepID=A0A9X7UW32_9GAMM|nr:DUF3015 family protein [Venatoribacter cucullus]QQD23960.1 DUF3015 domain-containing protein [Venatoribacter cucullus]